MLNLKALEIRGAILGWDTDPEFKAIAKPLDGISASPIYKLYTLWQMVPHMRGLEGEAAEIGVWRGGSVKVICERMKRIDHKCRLLLFDTFGGMPPCDKTVDAHNEGDFKNTSVAEVKERIKEYDWCEIIPGFFPATAPPYEDLKFKWVHIDVDIYKSVMDCCEWFYDRMVPGGLMIFDDYGTHSCAGAKKAVDEFFANKTEAVIYSPATQAFVIKH